MRLTRDELSDELQRIAQGDAMAFVRVYQATSAKLYGIIVRILDRGDLADEVLQDVYLSVWVRAKDYKPELASPITWLATIARNRALDETRRKKPSSIEDMPSLLERPSDEDIAAQYLESEERRRLIDCLHKLEGEERQVLQLIYYHGLTRQEVADRVGTPVATVKTWLRRGLKQLKVCLGS